MILLVILIIAVFAIIIIFSFPQFSPIPYYPSNMKDKKLILQALGMQQHQTIIDLGAGDGVVIFEAAREAMKRNLDTRFIALELNPVLVFILHLRRTFHPNRNNINVVWGDMFTLDYSTLATGGGEVVFYLYISPWLIERAVSHALDHYKNARFVSYYYPIKSMKKRESEQKGVHAVFNYVVPKS